MQRTGAMESAASIFRRAFPALLFLCLANSGCSNSCYFGFWNPNGSGVAVSNTSCPLTSGTGAVTLQMNAASVPSAASAAFPSPVGSPSGVLHIFVTLRSIEALPSAMVDENSSGWVELAPDLAAHPVQLDLLGVSGDSRSLDLPTSANAPIKVPAEEYRQLRLRLVPLYLSTDEAIPDSNVCGNVGWNCIVFADRSVHPLEFDGVAAEFHITQERGADDLFRVLPDQVIHLSIEFNAASSVYFPSNTAVRLAPIFSVVSRTASSTDSAQ
jgi:hypothetical protein